MRPCKNGAKCFSNNLGKRECHCPAGFTGEDCSIDVNECEIGERSPCEHNGKCINEVRLQSLNRVYVGAKCSSVIIFCNSYSNLLKSLLLTFGTL